MSIIDKSYIRHLITNNHTIETDINGNNYVNYTPVKYRWTHGATDRHLGDGILVYSIIQFMRAKVCVCLG